MFILDNCRNNLRGEQWQTVHKTALKWMRLRERGERDISYKIESVKKRLKKTLITLLCVDESKIKCCLTGDLHADKVEWIPTMPARAVLLPTNGRACIRKVGHNGSWETAGLFNNCLCTTWVYIFRAMFDCFLTHHK